MFSTSKNRNHKGFTLVELVIVILIISILAVVLIPMISNQVNKSKEAGVEVDMHTFLIAAKGAIISDHDGKLNNADAFVKELNTFLDADMQVKETAGQREENKNSGISLVAYAANDINNNPRLCNAKDPWGNEYEFRYYDEEHNGEATIHWVAFLSQGVKSRDGWIFEPDRINGDQRYGLGAYEDSLGYKYITVLGYKDGGVMVDELPEKLDELPNNPVDPDNPENKPLIVEIVNPDAEPGKVPDPKPDDKEPQDSQDEDGYAYLTFDIDEDDIEFDPEDNDPRVTVFPVNDNDYSSLGSGGTVGPGGDGGHVYNFINEQSKYYTGGGALGSGGVHHVISWHAANPGGHVQDVPDPNFDIKFNHVPGYVINPGVAGGGSTSAADIISGQGYEVGGSYAGGTPDGNAHNIPEDKIVTTVNLRHGNSLNITYNKADKMENDNWFKIDSTVTIEAVPGTNPDYTFKEWIINEGGVIRKDTSNPLTITVHKNTGFTAKFKTTLDFNPKTKGMTLANGKGFSEFVKDDKQKYNSIVEGSINKLFTVQDNGSNVTLRNYKGTGGNLVIPSTVNGKPVIIDSNSNLNNKNYDNVTIGNGVNLGKFAFAICAINNVSIGKDCIIDSNCFGNTSFRDDGGNSINSLTIDTNPGDNTFRELNIKQLTIGSDVTTIGANAFLYNNIERLPNLENITTIGSSAFNCAFKANANVGDLNLRSVQTIGSNAFGGYSDSSRKYKNNSYNTITIPDNVIVNRSAFSNTQNIEKLVVGNNVKLEPFAFAICAINNVSIGKDCTISSDCFGNTSFRDDGGNSINSLTIDTNPGDNTFRELNIKQLTIGPDVTTIGANAFIGNSISSPVLIHNTDGAVTIDPNAFDKGVTFNYVGK